jgi:hypothetical protein
LEKSVKQYSPSFDPGPCDGVGLGDAAPLADAEADALADADGDAFGVGVIPCLPASAAVWES